VHPGRATSTAGILDAAMPGSATIKRPALSASGKGGQSAGSPTTVVAGVAYRASVKENQGAEATRGDRATSVVEWELAFPLGTDVTAVDTVHDDDDATVVFQVLAVTGPQSYDGELRVLAQRRA